MVGGRRFHCGRDDWILGGEYTGQDVIGEAEKADLPQLFTGNGSGGWHIDSGSDMGADSSDVFLPYEAQDWEIYFFLKERPGRHLVDCLMGRLKPVGRSMVLGHLIGLE